MSEQVVRLLDDTSNPGKKVRTVENTVSAQVVLQQVITLADSAGNLLEPGVAALPVVGLVAHDAADSGNPVKVGGKYNATAPAVSDGDRVDLQTDVNGLLLSKASPDAFSVTITPTLDTSAYTAGDVLFDTTTLGNVARVNGGTVILDTVTVLDKDDQTAAGLTLLLLDSNVSVGTINNAPTISDANAEKILAAVAIDSGDWVDLGGCKVATKRGLGLVLSADAAARALYAAALCAGTPTQTASGYRVKFGFGNR